MPLLIIQQLTAQLCRTEAELQSLKLSIARSETASSAKVAAQSAGTYICTCTNTQCISTYIYIHTCFPVLNLLL